MTAPDTVENPFVQAGSKVSSTPALTVLDADKPLGHPCLESLTGETGCEICTALEHIRPDAIRPGSGRLNQRRHYNPGLCKCNTFFAPPHERRLIASVE
jgi:hypothetical protein